MESFVHSQIQPIVETDDRMVGSGRRNLTRGRSALVAVPNQKLPFVVWVRKLIEVKRNQIIKKVTFHLTTENVESGAENVQRVTVPSGRSRAWGY